MAMAIMMSPATAATRTRAIELTLSRWDRAKRADGGNPTNKTNPT
jgi:hypothetical protein